MKSSSVCLGDILSDLLSMPESPCSRYLQSPDSATTPAIVAFEIFVVLATIVALFLLSRFSRRVLPRYLITVAGVFIFEFFTGPMWNNLHMGSWAYVYRDVSWVLTLGWATMILSIVLVVDKALPRWSELQRFPVYLVLLLVLVFIFETVVVGIGIRSYAPEVLATISGYKVLGLPVEVLYYVPVFGALVIGVYKYWNLVLEDRALVPVKRRHWIRDFFIALLAVFLFELMVEPMVANQNFPGWSYVYRDITILMSVGWVLVIWLGTSVVDWALAPSALIEKFIGFLVVVMLAAAPIEKWLIDNGFRVYGATARSEFTGYTMPLLGGPAEVAFGAAFYLALVIAFIKYWQLVADNRW